MGMPHQRNQGNAANYSNKRRPLKNPIIRRSFWQVMWLWLLFTLGSFATDFSTTNTSALAHFWSAIESSNRPVTVLSFGDSMADPYRSPTRYLMDKLAARFGNAGYSLNNYRNNAMWRLTNGAFAQEPNYYWFTSYTHLPAGGAVWWDNEPYPGGVLCNQLGIYFVSQTNGGPFRMMISTNGGPWTTALFLNGYNLLPQGHFTNVTLPLNRYRIRVETDSGTNFILGPSAIATHTNGIHAAFIEMGGIALNQVTNVPLAIRQPIFAALRPDLLVWHMKEPMTGLSNRMAACENWWKTSAPDCDVVYIGTPWLSADTNTTTTIDQNTVVRTIALQYQRAYADLMQPTISYNWLLTNGYMADATHLINTGGMHCANIMWHDLGFFALGLNRRIALQPNGAQMQLSYNTSTNARYRLEASTNLQSWTALLTNPVATTTFTTNFPASLAPVYYRLGLTPP